MLASIWFILWGILWAVYFILDGFDLGVGIVMPLLARDEADRRTMYHAIGPFWDGNEVWLIAAGGITFAAFPGTYAVMFSALYTPLMLVLFALIIRGAAVALRFEVEGRLGRLALDQLFTLSSGAAAVLLGVAFANVFRGLPLTADGTLEGGSFSLLSPYGWMGGALFGAAFALHGCLWLTLKSDGEFLARTRALASKLGWGVAAGAALFLLMSASETPLWRRYLEAPVLLAVPVLTVAALGLMLLMIRQDRRAESWFASAAFIAGAVFFGLAGNYPALLPSRLDPGQSQTIYNSASGPYTLQIMLGVVVVMAPVVIGYQVWVYRLFSERIEPDETGY